ncbi:unnamed protein product [Staurois parvus]|uniref:Uncharacterized protein n=1 Tax=Staurois parvus TaxID=386267 RepID=A0ABN9FVN2_9NEOB|nr:unnamed protein product [Staurois parvus]
MHSPKNKKKTSLAIHTKLSMSKMSMVQSVFSGDKTWTFDQMSFIHNAGINPLGSTVSITSMLYCISRQILLLWV